MSKVDEPQRVKLGSKHARFAKASSVVQRSTGSDGYVTFAVGDRYKILEAIGTGAYGVVCSAIDSKTTQHVAIKKIVNPFEVLTTAKRTLRELKLLLHFKHDNVVGIRNIIQSEQKKPADDVYLVMDLMESDLHHIIRSEQALTPEHVCYFLYQLLRGLKYIHSANVIHRDLKPSNLLVNENCELKIGDFGMARGVSSTPEDHKMFMTEYVATRWYRAPELMLSIGEYSQAIDMWSVGCIFAEMIGRKQIFPGRHYVHQLQLVISVLGSPANDLVKTIRSDRVRTYVRNLPHKEPVKLKTLYPKASEQMLELLQSVLQFDPANRPSADQALTHSFFAAYHDSDDEPICPHPFDFRFESTVTKSDVCSQVSTVIAEYQDRKNRLSKQLIRVGDATTAADNDDSKSAQLTKDSAEIYSMPSISASVKDSISVFKKPSVPFQPQKVPVSKSIDAQSQKCLSEDVDMKSATSVSSMDFNVVDLTRSQSTPPSDSKVIPPAIRKDTAADKSSTSGTKFATSSTARPIITVQVVHDDVVDLTGDDSEKPLPPPPPKVETKKQATKSKKETDKKKKKTTISEDTKMKIRDSIFANMLSKQKGLGKPLEKVKKTVTAAERQREREEKRKKRLERAAQKEKKKEEEEKRKNPLSAADQQQLDRWMKMQKKKDEVQETNPVSTRTEVHRSKSNRFQTEGKPVKKNDIIRRQSFPLPAHRNHLQTSKSQENIAESSKFFTQASDNRIITVLFNGEDISSNNVTSSNHLTKTNSVPLNSLPVQLSSKPAIPNHLSASAPLNYASGFSAVSYASQNSFSVPFGSSKLSKPQVFASTTPANIHNQFTTNKPAQMAQNSEMESDVSKFIATTGGMFVPESNEASASKDTVRNRPTLLFPVHSDPKVLVNDQLLTPGKALQQNNSLTTPRGRNLATLSPDTIDYVLNDEFQKHSDFEPQEHHKPSINRPASYPSLTSADLDAFGSFNDSYPVPLSSPYRSNSFTHKPSLKKVQDTRDRATSCHLMSTNQSLSFARENSPADKKLNTASSFDFSPASFLKSLDEQISFSTTAATNSTPPDQTNGGIFVPNLDSSVLREPRASSVMMSDALPSAGAVSAVGYGLGVDIADIIPSSAGDAANSIMDYVAADQTDSSLLADWLDVSCLCPQDMEALQRELELGSPMSIDGS